MKALLQQDNLSAFFARMLSGYINDMWSIQTSMSSRDGGGLLELLIGLLGLLMGY